MSNPFPTGLPLSPPETRFNSHTSRIWSNLRTRSLPPAQITACPPGSLAQHEHSIADFESPHSSFSPGQRLSPRTMGQGASSQREDTTGRETWRISQFMARPHRQTPYERENNDRDSRRHTVLHPFSSRPSRLQDILTPASPSATPRVVLSSGGFSETNEVRNVIEENSGGLSTPPDTPMHDIANSDGVPLGWRDDIRMADVSMDTPADLTRDRPRSSYFSRVGARLMPRPSLRESTQTDQEGQIDEVRINHTLAHILRRNRQRQNRESHSRPSVPSPRGPPSPSSRRRPVTSISRPIPLQTPNWPSQEGVTQPNPPAFDAMEPPTSAVGPSDSPIPFSARGSRLSRVRNSVSMNFPNIFHSTRSQETPTANISPPRRPPRVPFDEDTHSGLPHLNPSHTNFDRNDAATQSNGTRSTANAGDPTPPRLRDERRLPSLLDDDEDEDGRTRLRPGEDQAAMLSRLLSVAAAATAASLVGGTEQAMSEAQDVAGTHGDGSFEGFLQNLRNGRLASALRNGGYEMGGGTPGAASGDGNLAPLNFFRMFRFGASSTNNTQDGGAANSSREESSTTEDRTSQPSSGANGSQDNEGRMVPVIIVGIRSMPPRIFNDRDGGSTSPFLDALSDLPFPIPRALSREGSGGFLRRTDRSRFARDQRSRRASIAGLGGSLSNYESQRHQRTSGSSRTPSESMPLSEPILPTVLSESPPGPHPPPSTPADPGFSASPSGESTPNQRPSTSTAPHARHSAMYPEGYHPTSWDSVPDSTSEDGNMPNVSARSPRSSDSDFARNRTFGSGSSRRNGIVGGPGSPVDRLDTSQNRGSASGSSDGPRSWIIYVLGGSYPENHPILTTPSLFTDSPTYEDMLLLSSILGPAKPPVATREEVNSAPGVYIITGTNDTLVAEASHGDQIQIAPGERCLVCLSDYELKEEVRQLTNCRHLFHRECIDQWLTTGRNSCPLCRGKGVEEMEDRS